MASRHIITLLSDFGTQDIYVAAMKGTIARVNPDLQLIDLTHQIPAQNIAAGRFCLLSAYPYFPVNTVHVAVVDPGVGSRRAPSLCSFPKARGRPDNGLISGILTLSPVLAAVELTNSNYWRVPDPSLTFHGRDIFAPVGAHLASGVPLADLGESINPASLVELPISQYQETTTGIEGYIQYIDRFGNLVTNIPAAAVENQQQWSLLVGRQSLSHGYTYADTQPGSIVALVGSHGWVEIAVNRGSARSLLRLNYGDPVQIAFR
ncbi:MAG: SAM-dependent chlorinase/fluorinase [Spirulinaceae cyanobacterium RM2_2_10]|nr:SAM-dependent chlorinase/fluorinase [Spirulinaceae cyanobacterium RM2_2_10]